MLKEELVIPFISRSSEALLEIAERITESPPEIFPELEAFKEELLAWVEEVNDLSVMLRVIEKLHPPAGGN